MNEYGFRQPVRRVEDRRFLTGRGSYVDDLGLPGPADASLLRAPHNNRLL
jgi:aerobic carbon-monoxide dehydrogenase large subunit